MSPVPFCCFGCLFCLHFRKIPYWNWIRLSGRVHLYSHLLMSNLQARMLTYMGTLMYLITGIYNVFVSHISSLYIYICILFIHQYIFKRYLLHLFILYLCFKKSQCIYIYIHHNHISRTYPLSHRGWVVLFGQCWRHFAAIVSYLHWNLLRWRH